MTDEFDQLKARYRREQQARLQAEKLLEEKSDELYEILMQVRSSESLLQSALKSMEGGMLILNQFNEVILYNDQIKKLYPSLKDHLARNVNLTDHLPLLIDHPTYQSIRNQETEAGSFEITSPNEGTIAINVRRTAEGFLASTHRDITDLLAHEEERRQLVVNLMRAQRMEAIGRMSGMIAHDFNNIIAAIKGYAGFLADDIDQHSEQFKSVQSIQSATNRAELMISQIIKFTSEQDSPRHDVSIIPVIEDCIDMLTPTLSPGIDTHFEEPEQPIWVQGNETRFSQLLTNLFTNACRAMADSGGQLAISINEHDDFDLSGTGPASAAIPADECRSVNHGTLVFNHPCVRIVISDSGHGMTPEVLENIFEFHFTTREGSAGLGMPSVSEIIVEHDGGIRVTSAENLGTAIEVVIPCVTYPSLKGPTLPTESSFACNEADVLLIDDDLSVGKMIRLMLERAGLSVEYVSDGPQALEELLKDNTRWRIVVSDQIMPGIKGNEILSRIRESGIGIPFLLCSAHGGTADSALKHALKDDFLRKPVDRTQLLERIRHYL